MKNAIKMPTSNARTITNATESPIMIKESSTEETFCTAVIDGNKDEIDSPMLSLGEVATVAIDGKVRIDSAENLVVDEIGLATATVAVIVVVVFGFTMAGISVVAFAFVVVASICVVAVVAFVLVVPGIFVVAVKAMVPVAGGTSAVETGAVETDVQSDRQVSVTGSIPVWKM